MCGIAGIVDDTLRGEDTENLLPRMVEILRHRGPDETGTYADGRAALGHARLSVIGLKGGAQPIGNESGDLWIVYNGETYNYVELKRALLAAGHRFTTETDTEVILHLFEEFGPDCVSKMDGQFAFAIWNRKTEELFLARDRVGIRPLYYASCGQRLIFASEIKALFLDERVVREFDPIGLQQVFTLWTTLTPRTVFRQIFSLPPGHFAVVGRDRRVKPQPFWNIPYGRKDRPWSGSLSEAVEELQALLTDAVRFRLRADVPVGTYLSGGLDSTIVTAMVRHIGHDKLCSFSLRFEDDSYDESHYQDLARRHLGTTHRSHLVRNEDIVGHLASVVWHCETPLLRTAPVPLYALSDTVRASGFKVVLTGEGADEVFGGYNIFKEAKVRRFWARQPESRLRPLLLERLYPYVFANPARGRAFLQKFFGVDPTELDDPLFSHRIRWANGAKNLQFLAPRLREEIDSREPLDDVAATLPADFLDRDPLAQAQLLEMTIFMSNYLLSSQGDRVAMAHSLEIRLPFLDHRLIDFAFRLPPNWLIAGLDEKHLLKAAFRDLVPKSIYSRPKQPYRAPIYSAFRAAVADGGLIQEMLSREKLLAYGYFDPDRVTRLITRLHRTPGGEGSETINMAFLGILTTQLLHYHFIENFPGRDLQPSSPNVRIRVPVS